MGLTIEVAALVLVAAALHATWNTFVKVSGDSLVTSAIILATGSFLCALALPWVSLPGRESWPYIAASVVIHNAYFLLLLLSYRFGDLSQVYPIARGTSPLIVAAFSGVVVGEALGWIQLSGALLVGVGIASLAGGGAQPHVDRRGVFYALACGLSIGTFALVDALGIRKSGEAVFPFILWLTTLECIPLICFALVRRRGRIVQSVAACGPRAVLGGILATLAYSAVLWAYANGPVAPVAALRETSVIMAALIGALRLGEPFGLRRIVAAIVVVVGVALLNTAA